MEAGSPGFRKRIDRFLSIADNHGIKPIFVLFDSCWDPFPRTRAAARAQAGRAQFGLGAESGRERAQRSGATTTGLRQYVQGVIGAFRYDKRVLAWDLWNEPDNINEQQLRQARAARTKSNWCRRCCPKYSHGRARWSRSSR